MRWKTQLRKSIATATRSAVLWSNNEYNMYKYMTVWIKENARRLMRDVDADGPQVMEVKEQMMNDVAQKLSEVMANMDGFMEELTQREPMDSLSEVDWDEVAEMYEDEVDEAIDFFG
mgnify:FL=1|tara:strand:+ start:232 stop:582 length:351 start_codon:yes stop_codon:yes gene_type:complete